MGLMSEYISRKLTGDDLQTELLGLISKYNKLRDCFLIVYVTAIGKAIPDANLNQDDFYLIHDLLKDVKTKKVDIYIETPGGSGEAAEEIVRCLHNKFDTVSFVVSGEAKSAGTIMVLSGDEILMTETGSLGPIDAQVKIGRSIVSAYDYIEWMEQKKSEADKNGKLNPFDATMVAQISPGELSGVSHALKYAEELVSEWLVKYKFKTWTKTEMRGMPVTQEMKEQQAKKIAGALINHSTWRTHGRSIKVADLHNIGLRVTRVEDNPELCDVINRIQTVCRLLLSSTTTYKIFASEKEKVFRNAAILSSVTKPPIKAADVAEFNVKCTKCGKDHKIYAKFRNNPDIDKDFKGKGSVVFPNDNKLKCDCGLEIDLSGVRNELETQTGKKIVN